MHHPPDVRHALSRALEVPDYFNTRDGSELRAVLRHVDGRPLTELLNTNRVRFDLTARRVFRDVFWKGSFAADTALGWEERLRQWIAGSRAQDVADLAAPGSFWKRFDRIDDDAVYGHVVNYELHELPGKPEVRQVNYPNDRHRAFREGDPVLLLNYTNAPYRLVYDVIKIVDDNNAIGIMHLGEFPNGLEFAPFAMARHNYPLEAMSIDDHTALFDREDLHPPGTLNGRYSGHVVEQANPHIDAGSAVFRKKVELTVGGPVASINLDGHVLEVPVDIQAFRELPGHTLIARLGGPGNQLLLVLIPFT